MDLFVYAPIGASIEFWDRMPDLARVGRERVANQAPGARMIGEFAVKAGRSKLDSQFGDATRRGRDALEQIGVLPRRAAESGGEEQPRTPSGGMLASGLAIADYDDLRALDVVSELSTLSSDELGAVRAHEAGARARRTILAKIDQLLDATADMA